MSADAKNQAEEKNQADDLTSVGRAKFEPSTYMPGAQFVLRLTLAGLAGVYFFFLPVPMLFLNRALVGAVLLLYVGFHSLWWMYYRYRGVGTTGIRLAAWVDVAAAFTSVLVDPYPAPPVGIFVLIAVLGNGIQHGLRIFLEQFITIVALTGPVFFFRQYYLAQSLPYQLVFSWLFMTICVYYSYLLVQRIERLKKEAEVMARQDPLTRLYNRNAFALTTAHMLSLHERNRLPLVLMFADLDNFKEVNDTLGHAFGDDVLRFFARLVDELLRKSDIAARYGGDEFVILLTGINLQEAEQVAVRLQHEFARWTKERGVGVGVSFGIGAVPERPVSLDDLLKHVDVALYQAKEKQAGKNIVVAPPL